MFLTEWDAATQAARRGQPSTGPAKLLGFLAPVRHSSIVADHRLPGERLGKGRRDGLWLRASVPAAEGTRLTPALRALVTAAEPRQLRGLAALVRFALASFSNAVERATYGRLGRPCRLLGSESPANAKRPSRRLGRLRLSGRRDSNSRRQPWQGCTLPLSYSRVADRVSSQPRRSCQARTTPATRILAARGRVESVNA